MNRADKKLYQMRSPKNINFVLLEKINGTGIFKQADIEKKAPAKKGGRTKRYVRKRKNTKTNFSKKFRKTTFKTTFKKGCAKT